MLVGQGRVLCESPQSSRTRECHRPESKLNLDLAWGCGRSGEVAAQGVEHELSDLGGNGGNTGINLPFALFLSGHSRCVCKTQTKNVEEVR